MGSSYLGRNEKSGMSTRKNKKSGSEKPKQPQRGLGVAQLEQIRLRTHFSSPPLEDIMRGQGVAQYGALPQFYPNYSPSSTSTYTHHHHPNFMMTFGEENLRRNQDSQPSSTLRWNPNTSTGGGTYEDNSTFTHLSISCPQHPTSFLTSKFRMELLKWPRRSRFGAPTINLSRAMVFDQKRDVLSDMMSLLHTTIKARCSNKLARMKTRNDHGLDHHPRTKVKELLQAKGYNRYLLNVFESMSSKN